MQSLSIHDLIVDIHALDRELQRYEEKYNLLSVDFHKLYKAGRLRDEDLVEIDNYGRWDALYRMREQRRNQYNQIKAHTMPALASVNAVVLEPYAGI